MDSATEHRGVRRHPGFCTIRYLCTSRISSGSPYLFLQGKSSAIRISVSSLYHPSSPTRSCVRKVYYRPKQANRRSSGTRITTHTTPCPTWSATSRRHLWPSTEDPNARALISIRSCTSTVTRVRALGVGWSFCARSGSCSWTQGEMRMSGHSGRGG